MSKTRIFVSSTCYDLSQIRHDLQEGIRSLGHEPILSESKDFPVDPSLTSVENCIDAVKREADVFVLIIGNRYGCQGCSGKSVTNLEFLAAVEKGIPIYSFSLKQMIDILPIWKKNPNADYSNVVDNNMVFEFLDNVRGRSGLWNFEFNAAQDILDTLKNQLSFLFKSSLQQMRSISAVDEKLLKVISAKAANILIEKQENYEMRFFFQLLEEEITRYQYLKKDCYYSVVFKPGRKLSGTQELIEWHQDKLSILMKSVDSLNNLIRAFSDYYGVPGVESDLNGLYYVAHRMGLFYSSILEWVIDVKGVRVEDSYAEWTDALANLPVGIIAELEAYPSNAMKTMEEAIEKRNRGEWPSGETVHLTMHLNIPEEENRRYVEEARRAIGQELAVGSMKGHDDVLSEK